MEDLKIKAFLSGYGDGSGDGDGFGYGSGSGDCYGDGDGYGYGYGDGSGYGDGDGDGSGYGSGSGDCYGDGNGDGSGYGSGSGDCYGDGYGYGSGSGDCYGIKTINNEYVYMIDGIMTLIRQVKGNIAKGVTIKSDLTLIPCFIVKQDNIFAHGETLHKAMEALGDKLFDNVPEEERINAFISEHKNDKKYPASDLYQWHHRLTGSCEMGRKQFADDHGIDLDRDELTVDEFILLTETAYGGAVIRHLGERWREEHEG